MYIFTIVEKLSLWGPGHEASRDAAIKLIAARIKLIAARISRYISSCHPVPPTGETAHSAALGGRKLEQAYPAVSFRGVHLSKAHTGWRHLTTVSVKFVRGGGGISVH